MNRFEEKLKIDNIDNIFITGLTNQLISFCVNGIFEDYNKNIIIVTNSLYEANMMYSSLSKLNDTTYLFPMDDFLTSEALAISPELKSIRLNTLNSLSKNEKSIVITNLMGYLRYLPTKSLWRKSEIIIKKGMEINKDNLCANLINIGYLTETTVTKTGEIANRGFILDVYPPNLDNPIRIEFWGDEIDSIRYFDIDSQRSLGDIDEVNLTPFSEFINEKNVTEIEEKQKFLPYVVNEVSSISDYLDNVVTIYKDYNQIINSYKSLREEIFNYDVEKKENYNTNYMHDIYDLEKPNDNIYLMTVDNILQGININKNYNFSSKIVDNFYEELDPYQTGKVIDIPNNKIVILTTNSENKLSNKEILNTLIMN